MNSHDIGSYRELEIYYRQKQKMLFRSFSQKNIIYWANEELNLPVEDDDVIHWWGDSTQVSRLANLSNKIILSDYDKSYLDVGFGDPDGNSYGKFITWR